MDITMTLDSKPDSKNPIVNSISGKADAITPEIGSLNRWLLWLYRKAFIVPWWGVFLLLVGIVVYLSIASNDLWANIFRQLTDGIALTLRVAFISYLSAMAVGLIIGMIRSSSPKPTTGFFRMILSLVHLAIYQVVTVFVEVMRGLPLLTTLVIFAFALIPEIRSYLNTTYNLNIEIRGSSVETAIIVLALVYGAFMSETFRAGIQSIEKGQIEASRALGLTYLKTMRFVVLPQAIRRILPPLGNDFVSMIKDSALVGVLGLRDITQVAKVSSGSSFRYMETYLTAAVLYLSLTIVLSLAVKYLERRLKSAAH